MKEPDGFKPKPDANTSENYQKIRKIGVDIEKAAIYFIGIVDNYKGVLPQNPLTKIFTILNTIYQMPGA